MLNYAVIGCGASGKVHGYYFSNHPEVNLLSVTDTNQKALEFFNSTFSPKYSGSKLENLLTIKPDIVSIATPPAFHKEQILSLGGFCKYIFCEKPLSTTYEDTITIIDFCKKQNIVLGVMLPRRFYNNSRSVKKVLESHSIGKIKNASFILECFKSREYHSTWRGKKSIAGGGVLLSQSIHSIDQLVYFFGRPVSVEGKIRTTRDYLEVEDEAEGRITFLDGLVVDVKVSANTDKLWRGITKIVGEKGSIVLDSADTIRWDVPYHERPKKEETEPIPKELKPSYYGPGHKKVIDDFIESILNKREPTITGENILEASRIIFGIYKSSEIGKPVVLSELV